MDIRKLNEAQLEKTADLSLEVSKTMLLATIVGNLIPGVGERIGIVGSLIGFVIFIISYLFAMWILTGVKKR